MDKEKKAGLDCIWGFPDFLSTIENRHTKDTTYCSVALECTAFMLNDTTETIWNLFLN